MNAERIRRLIGALCVGAAAGFLSSGLPGWERVAVVFLLVSAFNLYTWSTL